MDESKTREADEEPKNADATNKQTLEEIEQTEKVSDDTLSDHAAGESELPSPDGTDDDSKPDDAGPM